jgi:15-cis-phytoene synthase
MTTMLGGRELDAAGITDPALRAGYLRCRALSAEHGRSYHLATMLLPAAKRPYVHALYGFARHVDDLVDDTSATLTGERRAQRLLDWIGDFRTDLEWGATSDPIARAVLDTIARWSIPVEYFTDFAESMCSDLTVTSYATYAELERYMWGSAAVIGLQMLPILGRAGEHVRWDVLEMHAVQLGTAFQLTNFLRDVGEDLRRGRVYLPQESLDRFGVDRDRLERGRVDESIRNLFAWEIERARALYTAAAPGIELVDPTSRDCLYTASTLYAGIMDEIERADYDVLTHRVSVGNVRRAAVGITGARNAWSARRRGSAGRPTPTG